VAAAKAAQAEADKLTYRVLHLVRNVRAAGGSSSSSSSAAC
jgi:hypothetical protein